jgi:hypothetical protein
VWRPGRGSSQNAMMTRRELFQLNDAVERDPTMMKNPYSTHLPSGKTFSLGSLVQTSDQVSSRYRLLLQPSWTYDLDRHARLSPK